MIFSRRKWLFASTMLSIQCKTLRGSCPIYQQVIQIVPSARFQIMATPILTADQISGMGLSGPITTATVSHFLL